MAEMDFAEMVDAKNPLAVTDPELVPSARYYDEDFFKLECDRLWPHAWQMAARLEQIPNVGDWVEYANVGKSVLVVRTADGVKAYENHCRHRGVPLAGGSNYDKGGNAHGNCAKAGFICPFHGWRWNMDGENTFVYGRQLFSEDKLDPAALALKQVKVEVWGGCAFINHDPDAVSFRESMGPVLGALEARGMDNLRAEWWYGAVLPANWKIAMEAFMEGYHVMATHPQLQHAQPALYNARYGNDTGGLGPLVKPGMTTAETIDQCIESMELLSTGMAGLVHAKEVAIAKSVPRDGLPDDPQAAMMTWFGMVGAAITKGLQARGEPVPDLVKAMTEQPVEAVTFLFPHYFLLTYFGSMSSYRIRPLTAETCLFEIWSLTTYPPGEEPDAPTEPILLPFDSQDFPMIPRQDYSNIPIQQRGMHSAGFDDMRLSKDREGLISNYHRLIDGFIAGVDKATLAAACQKLGYNFDGPIHDLGF
jgi:nitrite reductase/ring-hydroxylating ferredoxin subunit